MKAPPLLPEEMLRRVLRVANTDGMSVFAVAGMLGLAAASVGDYSGAAVGLAVAAAGAIELHGVGLLKAGQPRGINWLLASQPYLLAVMLAYCGLRLTSYDPALMRAAMTDEMHATLAQAGYDEEAFLRTGYTLTFVLIAVATIIYQGCMTIYYTRRRSSVIAALEADNEHFESERE